MLTYIKFNFRFEFLINPIVFLRKNKYNFTLKCRNFKLDCIFKEIRSEYGYTSYILKPDCYLNRFTYKLNYDVYFKLI